MRALFSLFDKTGSDVFARALLANGFTTIYGSEGTVKYLKDRGIEQAVDVATLVGGKPIFGHRVVTLSREVYAGLLARDIAADRETLEQLMIPWIDLVYGNLYPLEETIAKGGDEREVIEKVDIGGPTLIRAAAKGRRDGRIVVVDPADCARVIAWIEQGRPGADAFVDELAAKAEALVSRYTLVSARAISKGGVDGMIGTIVRDLRYGENPYRTAALFKTEEHPLGIDKFEQVAGAAPSMINLTDLEALRRTMTAIAAAFEVGMTHRPYIALAVKHGNACGAAVSNDCPLALQKMIDGDPRAIFGGVVMTNFSITKDLASELRFYGMPDGQKRLLDGVIAPAFDDAALEILDRKEGKCRLLTNPVLRDLGVAHLDRVSYRPVCGGFIRQEGKPFVLDLRDSRMEKTGDVSFEKQLDMVLAWAIGSTSTSNTVTIVKDWRLLGNGVGQQSRVEAAELAIKKAREAGHDLNGAVAYSDSFFPFPDGVIALANAGIKTIFASSGSLRDKEVAQACIDRGVTLWRLPDAVCRGFDRH